MAHRTNVNVSSPIDATDTTAVTIDAKKLILSSALVDTAVFAKTITPHAVSTVLWSHSGVL